MRLLICGMGYLGNAVADVARSKGWDVVGLTLRGGEGTLACDVGDATAVRELAKSLGSVDAVVHCASSGRGGAEAYARVYVDGMRHLAECFSGARMIFTSSTSVYAQVDGEVVTEDSAAEPERDTGRMLLEAEAVALDAGGAVCRLSGIYGPGRSVILKKFLTGEAVIEEDGRRLLNQIHRDDAAAAAVHLLECEGRGIYNVTDDSPMSQMACYEGLARIFSQPMPPSGPRDMNRKRGWTHKAVSNGKLRDTGWQPMYASFLDAAEDIARTVDGV